MILPILAFCATNALFGADDAARPEDFACPISVRRFSHENTEWQIAYGFHLSDEQRNLPRVLLVGDSICNQYQEPLRARHLDGKINVSYWISSYSVGNPAYLRYLDLQLTETDFDIVYFNNGLHAIWGSEESYALHLEKALACIRRRLPKARVIWAATTPVANSGHEDKVRRFNQAAARVVAKFPGIETDDLHGFVLGRGIEKPWRDGVHFDAATANALADHVAETLLARPVPKRVTR